MNSHVRLLSTALASLLLLSCSTRTMPTAADMDRYYQKAEQMADSRIALLDGKRLRGEITQEEFETQSAAIRARIPNQATELAWARHENAEAQMRMLGIPTGDHPVQLQVPGQGGQGAGETFYRRAGQSGGENFSSNSPYGGSAIGGPNRGAPPIVPPRPQPEPEPEPPIDPGT